MWTDAYTAKRPAFTRLQQLLKRGSQGGPPEYWSNISKVLEQLPQKLLPNDLSAAKELLENMRAGVLRRDEPKGNATAAWNAYAITASQLLSLFPSEGDQAKLLDKAVLPLFEGYLRPNTEHSAWSVGPQGLAICVNTFQKLYCVRTGGVQQILLQEWRRLAECVVEDIKLSLPEQSQHFAKSQDDLSAEGKKWFSLGASILKDNTDDSINSIFAKISSRVLDSAVDILISRNGKPYGAAATIEAALRLQSTLVIEANDHNNAVSRFVVNELPTLVLSPSSQYLLAILYEYRDREEFDPAWNTTVKTLLSAQDSPAKSEALRKLFTFSGTNHHIDDQLKTDLAASTVENLHQAMAGNLEKWTMVAQALSPSTTVLSPGTTDDILSEIINALSLEGKASSALHGLDLLAKEHGPHVKTLLSPNHGSKLLSSLLFLTESPDDGVAEMASSVNASFESILSDNRKENVVNKALLAVINKGIDEAGSNSISWVRPDKYYSSSC